MELSGKLIFHHLPMEEEGSYSWCQFCKKPLNKLTIQLDQGLMDDYVRARCPKCDKIIWEIAGRMKLDKLDKKCSVCKNKTSDLNAYSVVYGTKLRYLCSKKCDKKLETHNNRNKR